MKKIFQLSLLAAATLSSAQALAASPKWDLIELDYLQTDIDDTDIEADGFSVMGSKLMTDDIFVTTSFSSISDDVNGFRAEIDTLTAGVGYRYSLAEYADWYGVLSYVDAEAKANSANLGVTFDDSSFGISTGIRSMLTDQFELAGEIAYVDIDEETTFSLKGYYYLSEEIAVSFGYGLSNERDTIDLGVRYAF